jgi:uncharacterized repeat protein (TIGR03803 family)
MVAMKTRRVGMKRQRSGWLVAFAVVLILATTAILSAQAQTFTVLHTFTNSPDGAIPSAIIRGAEGKFYGTTESGGDDNSDGTIFEVDKNGHETVLYRFTGGSDGALPLAAPFRDHAGNLYGTTEGNGLSESPSTVYKLNTSGQLTVLYTFTGEGDGCCADSPVVLDKEGNLYGTTPFAGTDCPYSATKGVGCGVVFEVRKSGEFSVLRTFTGPDGVQPEGGLVADAQGNLYGSTTRGGVLKCDMVGCGAIFKLDTSKKFTALYRFKGKADGSTPLAVIQDSAGNIYGWAASAGDLKCDFGGCGTIFEVDASGKFKVLYTFTQEDYRDKNSGADLAHLVRDKMGNLYGAAQFDGAHNTGFLYEVNSKGRFTDLFDFQGEHEGSDGFNPGGLLLDPSGNFYGTMQLGGDYNCGGPVGCGTVFEVKP